MLKSLELFGFKSFAERTRFELSEGITCVVGPNGSGKSNVVDAIKWLLGDQSPKSLRGKDMTDVIFNGSKTVKPSGFAEAILTFDNSNGLLELETDEVRIGRRLYRGGDSEYLINGNSVRLKDIRDLLVGTGAGLSAYNIIEQGRVGLILQGNSASRRGIFEEAAGIGRFKTRRVEAERKLERVSQNLLRLQDIVDEVEARLNSTRNQAAKAAKYRDVSQELQKWWHGLAADEYTFQAEKVHALDARRAELQERESRIHQQLASVNEEQARLQECTSEIEGELRKRQRQLSSLRAQMAQADTTLGYTQAQQRELEEQRDKLGWQTCQLHRLTENARVHEAKAIDEFTQVEGTVKAAAEQMEAAQQANETNIARAQRIDEQLAACGEQRARLQTQHTELAERIVKISHQIEMIHAAKTRSEAQRQQLTERNTSVTETLRQREIRVREATETIEQLQTELNTIRMASTEIADQAMQLEQRQFELRERKTWLEAQNAVLADFERQDSGIAVGVKDLLKRARMQKRAPWSNILGVVADFIKVDWEYAAVIAAALGERAQWLVVDDLTSILNFLDSDKITLASRIGLVPSQPHEQIHFTGQATSPDDSDDPERPARIDLRDAPGVVERADVLVTCIGLDDDTLAQRLLGDTWIVESLEQAFELHRRFGDAARYVTLQGELLDQYGGIHVGPVRFEQSLMMRKSKIRSMSNELQQISRDIEQTEAAIEKLINERTETSTNEQALSAQVREQARHLAEAKAQADAQRDTTEMVRAELETVEKDLARLAENEAESKARLDQSQTELVELEDQLNTLTEQANTLSEERTVLEEQLELKSTEIAETRLEFTRQQERLSRLRDGMERAQSDCEQRQAQLEEANRRRIEHRTAFRTTTLELLNLRAIQDERRVEEDRIVQEMLERDRHFGELEQQLKALTKTTQQQQGELQKTRNRLHELDIEQRDLDHAMEQLTERIQEEYQVTPAKLAEEGYSAYRLLLEERGLIETPTDEDELLNLDDESDEEAEDEADEAEVEATEVTAEEAGGEIPSFLEVREELEAKVNRLRKRIKMMGSVDTESLQNLDELETRYARLSVQLTDLTEAKSTLEEIVRRINVESRKLFKQTFDTVRGHFQEVFRQMFGGGEGDVILEDPNDVLECGIEIVARPPGKELRNLGLLSGGEKTMTAVALLFALFKSKPSPFCILDEVDAALDEANIDRYIRVLASFKSRTQFVMITHRKRTMTVADRMYGVTMEQAGVSKRLSVQFEDVDDDGHINLNAAQSTAA